MNKSIGVIGAGVIGRGVAQNGFNVLLYDISDEVLISSKNEIVRNLKYMNMFKKEFDVGGIMKNIATTQSYEDLADVDYIVENVLEILSVKENVY